MNISQYEAFLKTIELGSLTKAAETLGYTQSGLSHMMNALESDCDLKLMMRDRSGVRITADGQQLLPYFQTICNGQHNLSEKINEIHRLEFGLVRVGTFTSVSAQWLPGIIKRFHADFPKIQFELLHGSNNEDLEDWVINGRVDCAFVKIPTRQPLEAIFLRRDPFVAILPSNHDLADHLFLPVSALTEYPYIKLDESADDGISDIFESHQIRPNVRFVEKEDYAIMAMVDNGLGISVLPELVLKDTARKIVIKKLDIPAYRDIGIVVKNKKMLTASAQKFVSYVQEWITEEYNS
ncbi:LysR family transcriptional regulator [Aminipila luticellarii]|nr:LysR family transcriptional regulator [Aminipila luticellarii]